jgi:carbon storage regulator
MLRLTRRRGDGFTIGENIHVQIASVRRGVVTVRIDAPRDVPIARDELRERLVAEETPVTGTATEDRDASIDS